MKIKFSHILSAGAVALLSLSYLTSSAQDEGRTSNELQGINHQELNVNDEDKTLIYEAEAKTGKTISAETHQTPANSPKTKVSDPHKPGATPNNSNTKDGDDALSFNFLFYIIQKYKFSDIVDQ